MVSSFLSVLTTCIWMSSNFKHLKIYTANYRTQNWPPRHQAGVGSAEQATAISSIYWEFSLPAWPLMASDLLAAASTLDSPWAIGRLNSRPFPYLPHVFLLCLRSWLLRLKCRTLYMSAGELPTNCQNKVFYPTEPLYTTGQIRIQINYSDLENPFKRCQRLWKQLPTPNHWRITNH